MRVVLKIFAAPFLPDEIHSCGQGLSPNMGFEVGPFRFIQSSSAYIAPITIEKPSSVTICARSLYVMNGIQRSFRVQLI